MVGQHRGPSGGDSGPVAAFAPCPGSLPIWDSRVALNPIGSNQKLENRTNQATLAALGRHHGVGALRCADQLHHGIVEENSIDFKQVGGRIMSDVKKMVRSAGRLSRRGFLAKSTALGVASAVSAPFVIRSARAQDNVIKIGGAVPLSGPVAYWGISTMQGWVDGAAVINEAGGVNIGGEPHMLEIINYDTKGDRRRFQGGDHPPGRAGPGASTSIARPRPARSACCRSRSLPRWSPSWPAGDTSSSSARNIPITSEPRCPTTSRATPTCPSCKSIMARIT